MTGIHYSLMIIGYIGWFTKKNNFVLLLVLMKDLAIHFRLRQMPSQFSWTFSSKTTRLWIPQNTIPSYPSLLPIDHLSCLIVCEHHQIKLSPLPPFPHFDNLHSITVIFLPLPEINTSRELTNDNEIRTLADIFF